MSKIDELRGKYPKVTQKTFDKFVDCDKTPTKKYLEYLLKSWSYRGQNFCPATTDQLITLVLKFDELLPYITNKDIYAREYVDVAYLKISISKAEELKEEKTFVREENVVVIEENDEYILLRPITHRGSLKYGSQTRWCTASKNDPQVFKRYTSDGVLVYLIDKKGNKGKHYTKVALFSRYGNDAVTGEITVYNTVDAEVNMIDMTLHGWSEDVVFKVTTLYRLLFMREKRIKRSKDYVKSFTEMLTSLNFDTLTEHMSFLDDTKKIDYNTEVQDQINKLIKNLNNVNDARRTTTAN